MKLIRNLINNIIITKVIFCLVLIYASQTVMSQTEPTEEPDTLLNITLPSRLVITENESGMNVSLSGCDDNEDFSVSVFTEYMPNSSVKSTKLTEKNEKDWFGCNGLGVRWGQDQKKSRFSLICTGVAIGLVNPVNQYPEGGLQWSKSFEICWMMCCGLHYSLSKSSGLSFGLGFDWRNYKITTSDRCLIVNDNKGLDWGKYPEGTHGKSSRLKVFSLQLPFLLSCKLPKCSLVFKCGPIINFNTYASVLSMYEDVSGNEVESFAKDISPKRFTLDFFGSLSYRYGVGVYVRYSPMKVINSPVTLNFNPFSIGLTLLL